MSINELFELTYTLDGLNNKPFDEPGEPYILDRKTLNDQRTRLFDKYTTPSFSVDKSDEVFDILNDIICGYQALAFETGFRAGAGIMLDVMTGGDR